MKFWGSRWFDTLYWNTGEKSPGHGCPIKLWSCACRVYIGVGEPEDPQRTVRSGRIISQRILPGPRILWRWLQYPTQQPSYQTCPFTPAATLVADLSEGDLGCDRRTPQTVNTPPLLTASRHCDPSRHSLHLTNITSPASPSSPREDLPILQFNISGPRIPNPRQPGIHAAHNPFPRVREIDREEAIVVRDASDRDLDLIVPVMVLKAEIVLANLNKGAEVGVCHVEAEEARAAPPAVELDECDWVSGWTRWGGVNTEA